MELDLDYKRKSSDINNKSITDNPVFQIDNKNETNKRIINYLLWLTGVIGIGLFIYVSNPIATFFLGVVSVISVIALSFNTRATTADKRMIANLAIKLIEKSGDNNSNNKKKGK